MKRLTSLVLCCSLAGNATGCASWLSNFQNDPVAQVQETLTGVETLLGIAQGVVAQVIPLLSQSAALQAQQTFSGLEQDVRNAEVVLQDAITTAQQNNSGTIDLTTLMSGITTTAVALQTFIDGLQDQAKAAATVTTAFDQQVTIVKRSVSLYHNPR
jgi:uncharacterized protein YaaN involved in tellurite resistance